MKEQRHRVYYGIDLKSYYASSECVERGLDPLTTNLVVADPTRTEKTICLAVSPSLKAYGIPGRARLFEVVQRVKEVNADRLRRAPGRVFVGESSDARELAKNPSLAVSYIVAPPQMAHYMKKSTEIYQTYLRFVAPEDIYAYSIDEVFIDATNYLDMYHCTAHELAMRMIQAVLKQTGITATAGIGSNLYLAKIAMDIEAKHIQPDKDGVRIAELDEMGYRQKLWTHRPLTDFWRVGKGYARRLEAAGMYTMGDIARRSLTDENGLYKMFGVNTELLVDHAWGYEPTTMSDIKAYQPDSNSISSGQVLQEAYSFEMGRLVVWEMADMLSLDLVEKGLVTDQIVLTVGYDIQCMTDPDLRAKYHGPVRKDHYGRELPKPAHGSINLPRYTASSKAITEAVRELYDRIVQPDLLVRRMYVVANHAVREADAPEPVAEQMDLFTDYSAAEEQRRAEQEAAEKEKRKQQAMLAIRAKFGKNAILKGTNLVEGATARERNKQIGGHKA